MTLDGNGRKYPVATNTNTFKMSGRPVIFRTTNNGLLGNIEDTMGTLGTRLVPKRKRWELD